MKEGLIVCPCCGSDACSKNQISSTLSVSLCWTCGFTTNDQMIDGSDFEKENYEHTAELIKDLKQVHGDLAWYPKVINLQNKGMVFPEWNKRLQDWYWSAIKSIPILDSEKEKYPNPEKPGEYYEFKMDIKNVKKFQKLEFMDAAEEIGLFEP